ncbi:MAG: methyltransferase domain-containing protein [Candidatus Aegiribacteria sp.]
MNSKTGSEKISRVPRSKRQAKESYDRISGFYDYFAGIFERKYKDTALDRLSVAEGETVLEIGFGTGHCLKRIAGLVGDTGKACGIDISSGMLEETRKKLEKAGLIHRVELHRGDAAEMPFHDDSFDAVFSSFTLELFDTPEIPMVLGEIKRVLSPGSRFGVVSLSKEDGDSIPVKLYEWVHRKFPEYVDCRPIYVERSLTDAGFGIEHGERAEMFGLPLEIVVAGI